MTKFGGCLSLANHEQDGRSDDWSARDAAELPRNRAGYIAFVIICGVPVVDAARTRIRPRLDRGNSRHSEVERKTVASAPPCVSGYDCLQAQLVLTGFL